MKKYFLTCIALVFYACSSKNDNVLEGILQSDDRFKNIIQHQDTLEVQVLYTQIDRDENNNPRFRTYSFRVDSSKYFYPASTVKLPLILLAFEKLHELRDAGVDWNTLMLNDSAYRGQLSVLRDTTSQSGMPSVAHYAKKVLIVSDNDGANRLYELVGQKRVNDRLHELGFENMRIIHRLDRPLSRDENQHTEAVRFLKDNTVIYSQPMQFNDQPIVVTPPVLKGKGFIRNDSLVNKPFDFTYKNFYPLQYQQRILRSLIFPSSVPDANRFSITEEERAFVLKYMSQLPSETLYPPYPSDTTFYPSYAKFLLYGAVREANIPKHIRIFNKIGNAYGYLIDNAYIVDFDAGVEFMLSAVINTNIDGVYNDGVYAYDSIGYPFMRDLGQAVYNYELKRDRPRKPDLSAFQFQYDRQ